MTEDEAQKRWCPFVRVPMTRGSFGEPGINRWSDGRLPDASRCIASTCMAWRWLFKAQLGNPAQGFCGLAGKDHAD